MLYRFRKAMQSEESGWTNPSPNEPLVPATCESLPAALYARKELLKDVSRKISRIHDDSLDEAAIRTLNDDINRQLRKKHEWDKRVFELGHIERDKALRWGDEMLPEPGNVHGYLYFGRAKELPGVQELLNPRREVATRLPPRILAMQQNADSEYFGISTVEIEEARASEEAAAEAKLCMINAPLADWVTGLPVVLPAYSFADLPTPKDISIPTFTEVEAHLIERRRRELLRRYQ